MKNLFDLRSDQQMAIDIVAAAEVLRQAANEEPIELTASNYSTDQKSIRPRKEKPKTIANQGW
jgi:hypothetical protein|tara:strand:+ start:89 stop:277 length:189 start_codon:yes stop_codon:yes gene_type:complete